MSQFSTLIAHISSHEAHHMKNVLAEHGITAVPQGAAAAAAFGHLGPASDARLLVPTAELERAKAIIQDIEADLLRGGGADWFCGPCEEVNDGTFQYCWKCNKLREDVEDTTVDLSPTSDERFEAGATTHSPIFDATNPYASSGVSNEASQRSFSEEDESQVNRAFRASIIGFFFLPFLMTFYSIMLLLTTPSSDEWPDSMTRKFYWAWVLNIVGLSVWGTYASVVY